MPAGGNKARDSRTPMTEAGQIILSGKAEGTVLATDEPLSFWGGVDPATARVIDTHHPLCGQSVEGVILLMPSTRGSCSGSGVVLDLALSGRAPAALVFSETEDVATLGAMVAAEVFGKTLPVVRLSPEAFGRLSKARHARLDAAGIHTETDHFALLPSALAAPDLTEIEREMLSGSSGPAVALAMRILGAMAANQGAARLIEVTRGHIDGCIYASPANLTFAERMADLGGQVRVPTTMNAVSVDLDHWQQQGVAPGFGRAAEALALAYVRMGCQPTFTCAPYLLEAPPASGEAIGWSESNAVIYANSVLGARTAKHPDFLDLCIALTGRAPEAGVYLTAERAARRILNVACPRDYDDSFWPLLGYVAGKASPDRIPLLRGLASARPDTEALKALCAAFGTTSAAPMLHIEGITPESHLVHPDADAVTLDLSKLAEAWETLNAGPEQVDLIAIGSPHASAAECRALDVAMNGRTASVPVIVTIGRKIMAEMQADGTARRLKDLGVQLVPDLCWCSITEPVFPPAARCAMTNSGKYAHYGPGLSGRALRFGSMAACAEAAVTGKAQRRLPRWLRGADPPAR